jgi:hypothetical protein
LQRGLCRIGECGLPHFLMRHAYKACFILFD